MAPAIKFYNEERPHMSLGMITPSEAAKKVGELPKKWKSYREDHIRKAYVSKNNAIFAQQDSAVNLAHVNVLLPATVPGICDPGVNIGQDSLLNSQPLTGLSSPSVNHF